MVNFTVKSCYPDWLKIASRFCHQVSFFSMTEHLHIWRSWLKTGLPPTAVTSSEKTNGHQTHQTLILLIIMSGELCLNAKRHFNPSQIPLPSWRKSCKQLGWSTTDFNKIRPYWALSKGFELVWKLVADTLNTSSNKLVTVCEMSNFHVSFYFNTSTIMKIVIFIVIVLHSSVVV